MNESGQPPRYVIVTGPRGAGKTRWIREQMRTVFAGQAETRCAVLVAEQGRTRFESDERDARVVIRPFGLPCVCCLNFASLMEAARSLAGESGAEHVFLEIPALVAGFFIAGKAPVGWGTALLVVICDRSWTAAGQAGVWSPFQASLMARASRVVYPLPETAAAPPSTAVDPLLLG